MKCFSLFFGLIPFCIVSAQVIKVTDLKGNPIDNVSVEAENHKKFFFTNSTGEITLEQDYTQENFFFYHPDYESVEINYEELAQKNFNLSLIKGEFTLDEVVYSAVKTPEKKSLVPQQISLIESREIKLNNAPTTAEILSNSGNITVQKSQLGGGSPNIRGFEANKVLIMVDGVRMNNAIFRAGHLQNILLTNANAIDNIEIFYGSGSVMYGSDALGGSMVINTHSAEFKTGGKNKFQGKVYGRFASASNEKTTGFTLKLGEEKWATFTAFNYSYFGDLRQGARRNNAIGDLGLRPFYAHFNGSQDIMAENTRPNVQRGSSYSQYNFIQKLRIKSSENSTHKLNFHYSNSTDIPRYDRLTEYSTDGNLKYGDWYYGPQKWIMGSYEWTQEKKTRWKDQLKLTLAYQNFGESRNSRRFNSLNRKSQMEEVNVFSLNVDFFKIKKQNSFKYGLEAFTNQVDSRAHFTQIITGEVSSADTRYPDGGSKTAAVAAYATLQSEFVPKKLYISEGLRATYSYLHSLFNDPSFFPFPFNTIEQNNLNISGFVGLVYKPIPSFRTAFSINTGFRTPNVDDVGKVFDSVPGAVIVPNPNLKPEKTLDFNLAFSKSFKDKIKLETTGFYTLFHNIIVTQNGHFNGNSIILYNNEPSQVLQQQNAGKAYIVGFNVELKAKLIQKLFVSAKYNYTYGRVREDAGEYPLDHIPPAYGKCTLEYEKGNFLMELYTLFNGWKKKKEYNPFGEDNPQYATAEGMPSWYTINIKTSYQINPNCTMYVGLENLLDRNYRTFASGISAPGRNFIGNVTFNF